MESPKRKGKNKDCIRLVGQCDRERDAVNDGRNPKRDLDKNRGGDREHREPQRSCPLVVPYEHEKGDREDCDGVSHGAMRELGCQRVLKNIEVHWRKSIEPGRNDFAIHERPGIRRVPCLQAGHECASDNLHVDKARKNARPELGQQRGTLGGTPFLCLRRLPDGKSEPEGKARNRDGKRKMSRKPVLTHVHPVSQPALDHEPAKRALRSSQNEKRRDPRYERPWNTAAQKEDREGNKEYDPDNPSEKPVRPFPPIDGFEAVEAHAAIYQAVLGNMPVFLECVLPRGFAHWRHGAKDWLPLRDREAGARQAGGPSHDHHGEHKPCNRKKPDAHGSEPRAQAFGSSEAGFIGIRERCHEKKNLLRFYPR